MHIYWKTLELFVFESANLKESNYAKTLFRARTLSGLIISPTLKS